MGEGAFGKVHEASLHESSDKKFAIKSIPRTVVEANDNPDADPEYM